MINYSNGQYIQEPAYLNTNICIGRHTLNITFHWNLKEKDFRETKA